MMPSFALACLMYSYSLGRSIGSELLRICRSAKFAPFMVILYFYRLTLSTPKRCHMDLRKTWLVLTHHYHHQHQQLPSSTSQERVSSPFSFAVKCFLAGCLLPQFGQAQIFRPALPLEQIPYESSPLTWPTGSLVWPPRLLSHWSSSHTVPLTLDLRLLASVSYSSTGPTSRP